MNPYRTVGRTVSSSFWRGRRVFLTGHTGFKGSWLALWLHQLGAQVHGYALPPNTQPNLFDQARVGQVLSSSTLADVRDLPALQQALQASQAEVVVHMAAQPLVRRSYREPVETYATNVMGTVHLLEAVRHSPGVRAVVVVTTDKCYENREWVWGYRETDPMGGHDPYSNSKGCAELVTAAFRQSFFHPQAHAQHQVAVASARAGNVIGGGDWSEDRLLPDVFRHLARNEPVVLRNPLATRPWQHVLEPLRGYLMLAQQLCEDGPRVAQGYNFGPREDDCRTVGWVTQRVCETWGDGAHWVQDTAEQPHEARQLKLDVSKAAAELGWAPALPLGPGLGMTVDWARAYLQGADMQGFSLEQLSLYENAVLNAHT